MAWQPGKTEKSAHIPPQLQESWREHQLIKKILQNYLSLGEKKICGMFVLALKRSCSMRGKISCHSNFYRSRYVQSGANPKIIMEDYQEKNIFATEVVSKKSGGQDISSSKAY